MSFRSLFLFSVALCLSGPGHTASAQERKAVMAVAPVVEVRAERPHVLEATLSKRRADEVVVLIRLQENGAPEVDVLRLVNAVGSSFLLSNPNNLWRAHSVQAHRTPVNTPGTGVWTWTASPKEESVKIGLKVEGGKEEEQLALMKTALEQPLVSSLAFDGAKGGERAFTLQLKVEKPRAAERFAAEIVAAEQNLFPGYLRAESSQSPGDKPNRYLVRVFPSR